MQLMLHADASFWMKNWMKDGYRVVTVVKRDRPFESEARLLFVMRKKEKWLTGNS